MESICRSFRKHILLLLAGFAAVIAMLIGLNKCFLHKLWLAAIILLLMFILLLLIIYAVDIGACQLFKRGQEYKALKAQYLPEVTYKEFYSLYEAMPDNFFFRESKKGEKYVIFCGPKSFYSQEMGFKTFLDYCRYTAFESRYLEEQEKEAEDQKKREKRKKKQQDICRQRESYARLIVNLQKNLQYQEEENNRLMREQLEKIG